MTRCNTVAGVRAPPYDSARKVGRPAPSASSTSQMRASIVGTTIALVIPSRRTASTQAAASNRAR